MYMPLKEKEVVQVQNGRAVMSSVCREGHGTVSHVCGACSCMAGAVTNKKSSVYLQQDVLHTVSSLLDTQFASQIDAECAKAGRPQQEM